MKWTKLIYWKQPEGLIILRYEIDDKIKYEVGKIAPFGETDYFFPNHPFGQVIQMESIFSRNPYYINIDNLEMPE